MAMSVMTKKTIYLNQDYIDRAIKIFRVKTEKEAVNKSLELAVIDDEIIQVHKEIGGRREIEKVFE
jgi:Arc/MetJ family transcription regulator